MRRFLFALTGLSLATSLAACGQPQQTQAEARTEDVSYASPPRVTAVTRAANGGLVVAGQAGPDERIRLIDVTGRTHGVSADAQGLFSVYLPAGPDQDRLLSLTVQRAGRAVSSDGWLFSPAASPERAVMLRPGAASLPVGPAPLLATVDYDGGGGVALAGVAEPEMRVQVSIDGQVRGGAVAGSDGRWAATIPTPAPGGAHQITASAGGQQQTATVVLSDSDPAQAVETQADDEQIRVAWRLPGGGSQTSWILGR